MSPSTERQLRARRLFGSAVCDQMLRSTVRLARIAFAANAASVFLYERDRDVLVFEACSGIGEDRLPGVALPAGKGIAGWVLGTGESLVVNGAREDSRFDRSFAEGTGLVPDVLMAAPLLLDGEPMGVIEVLDPQLDRFGELPALDLLTEISNQSCAALSLLVAARAMEQEPQEAVPDPTVERLAALLPSDGAATAGELIEVLVKALESRG